MKNSKSEFFKKLTWSDVHIWAGGTITSRGQSYQLGHAVQDLAITTDGSLVAWVQGTKRYATRVDVEDDELTSECTCPYGDTCKHAVAVILDYLEKLKQNLKVPIMSGNDRRLSLLDSSLNEDFEDEYEEEDSDQDIYPPVTTVKRKAGSGSLHSHLEKQGKDQLIILLETIAERYPAANDFLDDYFQVALGDVEKLVHSIRKEIDRLSAEPSWRNSWSGEGEIPDYSEVRHRLEMLSSHGNADEVLSLGKRLLEAGTSQVEQSDDEGETEEEIASCINIVFDALSQSRLLPAEQMLWAVEADLADEYDLTAGSATFWEQKFKPADWSILADTLLQRMENNKPAGRGDQFPRNYDRDNLTDWITQAMDKAGRLEEIIPLLEQEAVKTGSYVRLVERLTQNGHQEEAEKWIREGVKATQQNSQGTASQLRGLLRKIREQQGNWLSATAFRSDDFFVRPTVETYNELRKAAKSAGVWPAVEAAVMHYLEAGKLPDKVESMSKGKVIPQWPLPETGLRETINNKGISFPLMGTLLDIAIEEKRPEDVIRWYDSKKDKDFRRWNYFGEDDKVAEAIKKAYPERTIAIWKKLTEAQIGQTKPKAYEAAGTYLNKLRRLFHSLERDDEWKSYVANLRSANIRKTRFLEVLSRLSSKPIIET